MPTSPESIAVALADKLDTLVGFWAIDEKPTGARTRIALRRAALGVIRIVLENELRLPLTEVAMQRAARNQLANIERLRFVTRLKRRRSAVVASQTRLSDARSRRARSKRCAGLLAFFADRLKVYLRDKGARHDLIDAVFALPGQDDLLMIVRRVEALGALARDRGRQESARRLSPRRQYPQGRGEEGRRGRLRRRARSASRSNSRRKRRSPMRSPPPSAEARERVAREDFEGAMRALAALRAPVDAFFVAVTVNAEDQALAPQPAAPARRVARGRARRRRFFAHRGVSFPASRGEKEPRRPRRRVDQTLVGLEADAPQVARQACHSRESGNPEVVKHNGRRIEPLPACRRSYAGFPFARE